jgi:hypothetical protein
MCWDISGNFSLFCNLYSKPSEDASEEIPKRNKSLNCFGKFVRKVNFGYQDSITGVTRKSNKREDKTRCEEEEFYNWLYEKFVCL